MKVVIKIEAETEDDAVINDAVDLLERMMPYMFDNVVVVSEAEQ